MALERFFSSVLSEVVLQLRLTFEAFFAHLANRPVIAGMDFKMFLQQSLFVEAAIAIVVGTAVTLGSELVDSHLQRR